MNRYSLVMVFMAIIISLTGCISCGGGSSVETTPDTVLPTATIDFPHVDNALVFDIELNVRGSAADNVGVQSVRVNGVDATSSDGYANWLATIPITLGENNPVTVEVTDVNGNVNSQAAELTIISKHGHYACSNFGLDIANNRVFTSGLHDLIEISLVDNTRRKVATASSPGYWPFRSPVFAGSRNALYTFKEGALYQVDIESGEMGLVSAEGLDGVTIGEIGDVELDESSDVAYVFSNSLNAIVSIDLATGTRAVISSEAKGTGTDFTFSTDLAFGNGRLFAGTGSFDPVVLEIDLSTGNRTVTSSNEKGIGTNLYNVQGIIADSEAEFLYVADINGSLYKIDISTGDRTVISPPSMGYSNGVLFEQSLHIRYDSFNSRALIFECSAFGLYSIDLSTGERSQAKPSDRGNGPLLMNPRMIRFEAARNRVLTINQAGAEFGTSWGLSIVAVDAESGDRSIVSNPGVGTGDNFRELYGMAVDTVGDRILVTDEILKAVFSVDPETGDRTILSSNTQGIGPLFGGPLGIAVDADNGRALVVDNVEDALYAVDLITGDRTIISQNGGAGSGDDFNGPNDVVIDLEYSRALIVDQSLNALFGVDLETGQRTIISSDTVGEGPSLDGPTYLDIDPVKQIAVVYSILNEGGWAYHLKIVDLETGNRENVDDVKGIATSISGVAVDSSSGLIYMTSQYPDLIQVYDIEGNSGIIISK